MDLTSLTRNIRRTLPDARLLATSLPLCPAIQLYLIDPGNLNRPYSSDEIQSILDNTPYWTFCWAGGQALAHYILTHREQFTGRRILDFGAGSGVVAIASALAGAAQVIACDIDPDALDAVKANAALNRAPVMTCQALAEAPSALDWIIAADVLYDRDNFHFLNDFRHRAPDILVADSRVNTISLAPYRRIAEIVAGTLPAMEDPPELKPVGIYHARVVRAADGAA